MSKQNVLVIGEFDSLDLTVRSLNMLKEAEVLTMADLLNLTPAELSGKKGMSKRAVLEIQASLHEKGLAMREAPVTEREKVIKWLNGESLEIEGLTPEEKEEKMRAIRECVWVLEKG